MRISLLAIVMGGYLYGAALKDKVVVRVNKSPITQSQIDRQVDALFPQSYIHTTVTKEKRQALEKKAIEELIDRELIYQYALSRGLAPSNSMLKRSEKKIISAAGSQQKFDAMLSKSKMTIEQFRSELAKNLTMNIVYDKQIRTDFSDADLKEYYDSNKWKFKEPEKIKLRMIFIERDPTQSQNRQKALEKANEAMAKIKKGEPFADIASKYSNAMSRINGGDMGYLHKGMMEDKKAESVAFKLKIGEISPIVESDIGFYIMKLEGKSKAVQHGFETVKESLRKELKQNREKEKIEKLVVDLKKQAKIVR